MYTSMDVLYVSSKIRKMKQENECIYFIVIPFICIIWQSYHNAIKLSLFSQTRAILLNKAILPNKATLPNKAILLPLPRLLLSSQLQPLLLLSNLQLQHSLETVQSPCQMEYVCMHNNHAFFTSWVGDLILLVP